MMALDLNVRDFYRTAEVVVTSINRSDKSSPSPLPSPTYSPCRLTEVIGFIGEYLLQNTISGVPASSFASKSMIFTANRFIIAKMDSKVTVITKVPSGIIGRDVASNELEELRHSASRGQLMWTSTSPMGL
ncbi:hypothetical protein L6452_39740 [Arctium lappa]|uniref:Uncharacterized protein n=1 Tax=Arctium lappa TaxID=4217 RepID=A0ACB8XTV1_ARCLA|nr:hypothetical protein L6452_39740 [Arctium lappa]